MLGAGAAVLPLELMCLHLTSERPKERSEALAGLREIIQSQKEVEQLSNALCTRVARAFFAMLAIECKHSTRNDQLSPQMQTKMQQLLRDAKSLVNALASLHPRRLLGEGTVEEMVERLLSILRSNTLGPVFPEALSTLTSIMSHGFFLCLIGKRFIGLIVTVCQERILTDLPCPPATGESECSKSLFYAARFYYDTDHSDGMMQLCTCMVSLLTINRQEITDSIVLLNAVRTLKVCLAALQSSHPVFCRDSVKLLAPFWSRLVPRHSKIVEELLLVFHASAPALVLDVSLKQHVSSFLLREVAWGKFKFKYKSPIDVLQSLPDDLSIRTFLRCMSVFCDFEWDTLPRFKNELPLQFVWLLAQCFSRGGLSSEHYERVSESTSTFATREQAWIFVSLGCGFKRAKASDSLAEYAYSCIGRPEISDSAVYFVSKYLEHTQCYFSDLTYKLAFLSLTPSTINVGVASYQNQYQQTIWCSSAVASYSRHLNIIDDFLKARLESELDPKQCCSEMGELLFQILNLLMAPFVLMKAAAEERLHFKFLSRACETIQLLEDLFESLGSFAPQTNLLVKLADCSMCIDQAVSVCRIPITVFQIYLRIEPKHHLHALLQCLDGLKRPALLASWVWTNLQPLLQDGALFSPLRVCDLISTLVGIIQSNSQAEAREGFASTAECDQQRLEYRTAMQTIVKVYKNLCEIEPTLCDYEERLVVEDCAVFILESFAETSSLSHDEIVELVALLPNFRPAQIPYAEKLLDAARFYESKTMIRLCVLILERCAACHNSGEASSLLVKILKVFRAFDHGGVPLDGRIDLLVIAELLRTREQPAFLSMEKTAIVVNRAFSYFGQRLNFPSNRQLLLGIVDQLWLHRSVCFNDPLPELSGIICERLPSPNSCRCAAALMYARQEICQSSLLESVFQVSASDVALEESFWFWSMEFSKDLTKTLNILRFQTIDAVGRAFAPVMAHAMICYFGGGGDREKSAGGEAIRAFKDILGEKIVGRLLKSCALRIIAYVILFSINMAVPITVRQKCLSQIAGELKIKENNLFVKARLELFLMELLDVCHEDYALVGSFARVILQLHVQGVKFSCSPVSCTVRNYLRANFANNLNQPEDQRTCKEALDAIAKKHSGSIAEGNDGDWQRVLESLRLNRRDLMLEVRCGVSVLLQGKVADGSQISRGLFYLKKAIEIINFAKVPEPLQFLELDQGYFSLLDCEAEKIDTEGLDSTGRFYWETYHCAKSPVLKSALGVIFRDKTLLEQAGQWIIAEGLMQDDEKIIHMFLHNIKSPEELRGIVPALAEAIKHCFFRGKNLDGHYYSLLPPTLRLALLEQQASELMDPVQLLFFAEHFRFDDPPLFFKIYTRLGDQDYTRYFEVCSDNLNLRFNPTESEEGQILKTIENSMLLNQSWEALDIATGFNHASAHDSLYLELRKFYFLQNPHEPVQSSLVNDVLSRVVQSSLATLKGFKSNEEFVRELLKLWGSLGDGGPRGEKLLFCKCVGAATRWNSSGSLGILATYSKADLLWEKGQRDQALRILLKASHDCAGSSSKEILPELSTRVLLKAAKCCWISKSKPANQVQKELLDHLCLENIPLPLCSKAHHMLATFYDDQYKKITSSELLASRKRILVHSQKELEQMRLLVAKEGANGSTSCKGTLQQLEKQVKQDHAEIERILEDREQYSLKAAQNYLQAIVTGEKYDLTVFRLCSLWFTMRRSAKMNALVSGEGALPVYKLLPLMYQLVARAETTDHTDGFQVCLQGLLYKILVAHPHHSLYQFLALRASSHPKAGSKRTLVSIEGAQERRAMAAAGIIAKAKASSPRLARLICDTETLWLCYSEIATVEVGAQAGTLGKGPRPFENGWAIGKIRNLNVPLPTRKIAVDPLGKYDDLVTVEGFSPEGYRVIGGINLPKIVECKGSDGVLYRQLIKGKDDVRQDAVMEQVFQLVNQLLAQNTQTGKRHLKLRTYRVIPLQPLAGLLEWVPDSIPIGDYLSAAHERLCPTDIKPREARATMTKEFARAESNPRTKHQVFCTEILPRFRPVFQSFFLETTCSTKEWYEKRRRYIDSSSVGSMIGYVVGLGDRHCQNIMIDQTTGEIIHIDLNMIFEVGKTLRIPERVPFRLTRDLVAGMGFVGLEAGFIGASEAVMRLLKSRMEMVLMIMEAFKYDPLYRWSSKAPLPLIMEAAGALYKQGGETLDGQDDADDGHKEAERALLRVREKLMGVEEGTMLSERGQVNYLVQLATNEELLAQMYPGWQPWM